MNITKDSAVTISYKVTTPQGKPLDAGSLSYLHGGYENIFPKVEAALEGQAVGYTTALDLSVEDAFGARNGGLQRERAGKEDEVADLHRGFLSNWPPDLRAALEADQTASCPRPPASAGTAETNRGPKAPILLRGF